MTFLQSEGKRWAIDLDISAPQIIIPDSFHSKETTLVSQSIAIVVKDINVINYIWSLHPSTLGRLVPSHSYLVCCMIRPRVMYHMVYMTWVWMAAYRWEYWFKIWSASVCCCLQVDFTWLFYPSLFSRLLYKTFFLQRSSFFSYLCVMNFVLQIVDLIYGKNCNTSCQFFLCQYFYLVKIFALCTWWSVFWIKCLTSFKIEYSAE